MEFIVTTKTDLENIILASIRKVLGENTNQNIEETDKNFSVQEAATYLNLAPQTLYGLTSKREIPFIKRGKKLYFRKSELNQWLSEGKKKSKNEIINDLNKNSS